MIERQSEETTELLGVVVVLDVDRCDAPRRSEGSEKVLSTCRGRRGCSVEYSFRCRCAGNVSHAEAVTLQLAIIRGH